MLIFIKSMVAVLMALTLLQLRVFAQEESAQGQTFDQNRIRSNVEIVDEVQPEAQIPLVLIIEPVKTEYAFGEKVELGLSLVNRGHVSLRVKELSEKTVYCLFNGASWGTKEPSGPEDVILGPGESSRKKMRFVPIKRGKLDIVCSYGMGFKGIRPSGQASIKIK